MLVYSRPLGDTVRNARTQEGLTKKQLADKIDVDERTITSIETYKSNTMIEVLYPLLCTLTIRAPAHYQIRNWTVTDK